MACDSEKAVHKEKRLKFETLGVIVICIWSAFDLSVFNVWVIRYTCLQMACSSETAGRLRVVTVNQQKLSAMKAGGSSN